MPSAKELLQQGELTAAIDQIISEVKARPTDTSARIFLFELLCFAGELDRAEKQLDVIATQSTSAELGVLAYRNCLKAERERRQLWKDGTPPHFLSEPPPYVDLQLDAIKKTIAGELGEARVLLDQAEAQRPESPCLCDGEEVYDWRDADDFTASILEVIVKDEYVWLPIEQIRTLTIAAPETLRDLLFVPVQVETIDGTLGQFFAFTLYAGSGASSDNLIRLGRKTEWEALSEHLARGAGLKMWMLGDDDKTIFEVKKIEFPERAEAEIEEDEADAAV